MPLIPFVRMSIRSSNFLSRFSAACAAALTLAFGAACLNAGAQTTTPTHPPYVYTITDLGIEGNAINESGDVAGVITTSTGAVHAALYTAGTVIDLGVVPGASASIAYGINGYDQVTGEVDFTDANTPNGSYSHAFLYSAGKMIDIGTLQFPGAPFDYDDGAGTSINDSGQVAGISAPISAFGGGVPPNVFLYSAGKLRELPGFYAAYDPFNPSYEIGTGNNINASGQIAGVSGNVAAIYNTGNDTITLLDPSNSQSIPAQASALNDSGGATGLLDSYLAYLYSNDTVTKIGPAPNRSLESSNGIGINASGQVVGYSIMAGSQDDTSSFLYTPGQGVVTLSFVPGSVPTLFGGNYSAINDKGQIVAGDALLSPVFQSFSTLATVASIGTPGTTFAAGGRFVLAAKSNGIYPLAETLVLQLGGYHISIPPGSFTTQANGVYTYTGNIGSASVFAVIRPLGSNIYLFGIVAKGVTALPTSYPYNLTVTIGDDTGSQAITSNYNTSGLTEAEVCQDFGLTCK